MPGPGIHPGDPGAPTPPSGGPGSHGGKPTPSGLPLVAGYAAPTHALGAASIPQSLRTDLFTSTLDPDAGDALVDDGSGDPGAGDLGLGADAGWGAGPEGTNTTTTPAEDAQATAGAPGSAQARVSPIVWVIGGLVVARLLGVI